VKRLGRYILDGHTPVECEDLMTWARWMESGGVANRRVAWTETDDVRVSTVFMALDHNFDAEWGADPILFETMVFRRKGESWDGDECERYRTWDEAEAGHRRWVKETIGDV
jgi:hypothetical protein